jgi:hypothetical protein
MGRHEEFLELCAAATAGELTTAEQAKLNAHMDACPGCRRAMSEYEAAVQKGLAALSAEFAPKDQEDLEGPWSVEAAEKAFFKRLNKEQEPSSATQAEHNAAEKRKTGQRLGYRPLNVRWREVWMPFAAAGLLALALGIATYRARVSHDTNVARTSPAASKDPVGSLEKQASDAAQERAQMLAKLAEDAEAIDDLKRQLLEQMKVVSALKATDATAAHSTVSEQQTGQTAREDGARLDQALAAQGKFQELQMRMDEAIAQREEVTARTATLEAKIGELTRIVQDRERALDQEENEVTKQQELLEHDRDIRELMGARDLYIAEVHDVSRTGTDKTYGRVFYTKGKSLVFYAYDLDAQPGLRNASSFQAWGRRGPDKHQALSLGIFYEDNVGKKRWVLKADDPKSLDDIDAVFVTVEPNGGSQHPSGKQLLFAYLGISPNHP